MFGPRAWWGLLGWPGVATLTSLGFAWVAIGLAAEGSLRLSVFAALVAFILDMLDGFLARRMGRASDFGRLLDSAVDLVNYSIYAALLAALYLAPGALGWATGFVIVATGALRLVRFTIDGFDDGPIKYYRGVVTCHLSLAAMALLMVDQGWRSMPWIASGILLILSVLQLAGFRFRKTGRQALWASLVLPLAVGAVLWLP